MKIGLVLEGGAMRGMYTAGVLDTFLEHDVTVHCVVGVSAGALFGVNLLSRQKGRVIRYNKRFNSDKNYLGLRPLLREGNIVSTSYAYEKVPRILDPFDDETYKNSGIPFYAVVTDTATGQPEYMQIHSVLDQMDTLRASGSMPFLSKPVTIGSRQYLDGAVSDSIPFEWMMKQGCDKVIVVLTRDPSYRKKPMSKSLIRLFYRKQPQFAVSLANRHNAYNDALDLLAALEQQGKVFVIRPSEPIEIGRIESDPEKLQQVHNLGTADTKALMDRLHAYLERI